MFGDLNVFFAQIHKWSLLPCEHTKTNGKNLIEHKPNKGHDFARVGVMPKLLHCSEMTFLIHPLSSQTFLKGFSPSRPLYMPCNQRKEKTKDHATYPIPRHLGLLEVFNKPFCIKEEVIIYEEV
jgi:hypothetical protein